MHIEERIHGLCDQDYAMLRFVRADRNRAPNPESEADTEAKKKKAFDDAIAKFNSRRSDIDSILGKLETRRRKADATIEVLATDIEHVNEVVKATKRLKEAEKAYRNATEYLAQSDLTGKQIEQAKSWAEEKKKSKTAKREEFDQALKRVQDLKKDFPERVKKNGLDCELIEFLENTCLILEKARATRCEQAEQLWNTALQTQLQIQSKYDKKRIEELASKLKAQVDVVLSQIESPTDSGIVRKAEQNLKGIRASAIRTKPNKREIHRQEHLMDKTMHDMKKLCIRTSYDVTWNMASDY